MNKEIGKHCLSMLLPAIFLSCSANTGEMFGEAAGECLGHADRTWPVYKLACTR